MKAYPTQIETFRNCPRKFMFDRTPEIRDRYRRPSEPLYVGICVHDALDSLFNLPAPRRTYETLVQLLREAWAGRNLRPGRRAQRAREREVVFGTDRNREAAAGERAKKLLRWFVETQDLSLAPATRESFFEVPFAERHILGGKIDRIDRLPDGTYRIVDYKTGKAKSEDFLRKYDLQLAAYSVIARRQFGPVSRCVMLYLEAEQEVGFEPNREWLASKEEEIRLLLDAIEEEQSRPDGPAKFPPTPNVLCGWCDYRELCPEGQAWLAAHPGEAPSATGPEADLPF